MDYSNSDAVVFAGDIHIGDKGLKWILESVTDVPVIYVLGNHEYYGQIYPKLVRNLRSMAQGTNVHVLENNSVVIDSIMFMGCTLWTDFELFGNPRVAGYECQQVMNDFRKIRIEPNYSKLRSIDAAVINKTSLKWLKDELTQPGADIKNVVVTHHAPTIFEVV